MIRRLAQVTGSAAIAGLDAATLLGERAMLAHWLIPGLVSAGGGARLFDAIGDTVALNLSRPEDRALLPALFETDDLDASDDEAIGACIRRRDAEALVARGRSMGLAVAREHEKRLWPALAGVKLADGSYGQGSSPGGRPAPAVAQNRPRVLDLSALWAGPLAAHLLWLAGADVVKVESRTRPDGMRNGDRTFYALLLPTSSSKLRVPGPWRNSASTRGAWSRRRPDWCGSRSPATVRKARPPTGSALATIAALPRA
jgi:hypothetical protein